SISGCGRLRTTRSSTHIAATARRRSGRSIASGRRRPRWPPAPTATDPRSTSPRSCATRPRLRRPRRCGASSRAASSPPRPASEAEDSTLVALLDELTTAMRTGRQPDVEQAARRHPALTAELRSLWATAWIVEEMAGAEPADPDPEPDRPAGAGAGADT